MGHSFSIMKVLATLLCLACIFAISLALVDPNLSNTDRIASRTTSGSDEDVCGTAQMTFNWGFYDKQGAGEPRIAEIYFYFNNTFIDNTYNYDGNWLAFGENGEDILVFNYPSATYVSPNNDGRGSMISHTTCGTWSFSNFKWYCGNACTGSH